MHQQKQKFFRKVITIIAVLFFIFAALWTLALLFIVFSFRLWPNLKSTLACIEVADQNAIAQAIDADGKMFASAGEDGTVIIRSTPTGDIIKQFKLFKGENPLDNRAAFHPKESILATLESGTKVVIWNYRTDKEEVSIDTGEFEINRLFFSKEGDFLLVCARASGETNGIWKVSSKVIVFSVRDFSKVYEQIEDGFDRSSAVDLSPDKWLSSFMQSSRELVLTNIETKERRVIATNDPVNVARFHPVKNQIFVAQEIHLNKDNIVVYDSITCQKLHSVRFCTMKMMEFSILGNTDIIFAGSDNYILYLVDVHRKTVLGKRMGVYPDHIAVSSDGLWGLSQDFGFALLFDFRGQVKGFVGQPRGIIRGTGDDKLQ